MQFNPIRLSLAMLWLSACVVIPWWFSRPQELSVLGLQALATDVHMEIADVPIVVPLVGLPDYATSEPLFPINGHEQSVALKERSMFFKERGPMKVDGIMLQLKRYGMGPSGLVKEFCGSMSRQWVQSVCSDAKSPFLSPLSPTARRVWLFDDRKPEALKVHWFTIDDREPIHSLARTATASHSVKWQCFGGDAPVPRRCFAAAPVRGHLVAIWQLYSTNKLSVSKQAESEGSVIAALVLLGMGLEENYEQILLNINSLQ